jgi:hypothetical protein
MFCAAKLSDRAKFEVTICDLKLEAPRFVSDLSRIVRSQIVSSSAAKGSNNDFNPNRHFGIADRDGFGIGWDGA